MKKIIILSFLLLLQPTQARQTEPAWMIFVTAGQSNMQGFSNPPYEQIVRSNIKVWTPSGWALASEPIQNGYAGPGMGFAITLQNLYGHTTPIALIPCAVSGSTIQQWQRGQGTYTECVSKTLAALATQPAGTKLSGVLFAQGEANTYTQESADSWLPLALSFARDFRTDTGKLEIPFLYAQLGEDPNLPTHPFWTYLQRLQPFLTDPTRPYIRMISTKYIPINKQHFANSESYDVLGSRFAAVYFVNFFK